MVVLYELNVGFQSFIEVQHQVSSTQIIRRMHAHGPGLQNFGRKDGKPIYLRKSSALKCTVLFLPRKEVHGFTSL